MNNIPQILTILEQTYPDAKPQLNFNSTFELLAAVILSAQCTDARVNIVTQSLFPTSPQKIIQLGQARLQEIIKPCGYFRAKADHILRAAQMIIDNYGGNTPSFFDGNSCLHGVGRNDTIREKYSEVILMELDYPRFTASYQWQQADGKSTTRSVSGVNVETDDESATANRLMAFWGVIAKVAARSSYEKVSLRSERQVL